MARKEARVPGGELEYAVLRAVWQLGSASAREVHDLVGAPQELAYTTTARVIDRLIAKGILTREPAGRAFVYRAAQDREVVERARTTSSLARLFGDEPRPAIAHLVDAVERIDPELLDELARQVAARRRSRRGP